MTWKELDPPIAMSVSPAELIARREARWNEQREANAKRQAELAAKVETERSAKHAAAKELLERIAAATDRLVELRPLEDKINSEKDSAAAKTEKACKPIREKLAAVNAELDAQRPSGKPLSPALLARRQELEKEIALETDKLFWLVADCDQRLVPIVEEQRELRSIVAKTNEARAAMLQFAPPALAARLHVASKTVRSAESRAAQAAKDHDNAPSFLTLAEIDASNAALATAHQELAAAHRAALEA